MAFKDEIFQLAERVQNMKDCTQTEEATKTAFIMPFIKTLGYDVFNPQEVMPEFIADVGIKKGEKVDYAIMRDGKPIIVIECKWWGENLEFHKNQLYRYFTTTDSKFAVLTNGIRYLFFSDLDETNKMDTIPFLDFDITQMTDTLIDELEKFHKSNFEISKIVDTATELKYRNEVRKILQAEFDKSKEPSPDFVRYLIKKVYSKNATDKIVASFTGIVKTAIKDFVTDLVDARLRAAMKKEEEIKTVEEEEIEEEKPAENKIETTEMEIEGYLIVRTILRGKGVKPDRVVFRDTLNYCGILLDDNNRKTICRLWLNSPKKKYISIFDNDKNEKKVEIETLDDIYKFEEDLFKAVQGYDESGV